MDVLTHFLSRASDVVDLNSAPITSTSPGPANGVRRGAGVALAFAPAHRLDAPAPRATLARYSAGESNVDVRDISGRTKGIGELGGCVTQADTDECHGVIDPRACPVKL